MTTFDDQIVRGGAQLGIEYTAYNCLSDVHPIRNLRLSDKMT